MQNHLQINGQLYDLIHLRPFTRVMDLDLRGGNKKKGAHLEFRFSNHCYSRSPAVGEVIPPGELVQDGSKHSPRNRIFCPLRYEQSLSLVAHIDELIHGNGTVHRSRKLNFFTIKSVSITEFGLKIVCSYFVFMSAAKRQDAGKPKKIEIFVESAYLENPNIPNPNSEGNPLKFSEVLGKVWEGC